MPHLQKPDQEKMRAYWQEIRPLQSHMADLVLLYCRPVWEMTQRGHWTREGFTLARYEWTNPEMEAVFHHLEATIQEVRESYFADRSK